MKSININEFVKKSDSFLEWVEAEQKPILLKRNGGRSAVILPHDEFNSIMETLHLLGTKANALRLFESIEQMKKGLITTKGGLEGTQ